MKGSPDGSPIYGQEGWARDGRSRLVSLMTHPRIVAVPTVDHHESLMFALNLEKIREVLRTGPSAVVSLHLSGEALTWGKDDVLLYERLFKSGSHFSIALDGRSAREAFTQILQNARDEN